MAVAVLHFKYTLILQLSQASADILRRVRRSLHDDALQIA